MAFSAVNLAVVKTHLLDDASQRNAKGLLSYGVVPLVGLGLTLWLWTSLSALTLVIGLCWFALGLAYLAILTAASAAPCAWWTSQKPPDPIAQGLRGPL